MMISNDDCISGTCIAPHLSSCCLHHRMHPLEIPKHCNMITLVVGAEIDKMNMVTRMTKRILRWLKMATCSLLERSCAQTSSVSSSSSGDWRELAW